MSKAPVRVHEDDKIEWLRIREVHPHPEGYPDEYLDSDYRIHEIGTEDSLQLLEAKYLPNTFVDIHAHLADEIIYVLEGSMIVGNKSLQPGSSIFVNKRTLYSFKAGPDGLRFLNFRPVADHSHLLREEYQALKDRNWDEPAN